MAARALAQVQVEVHGCTPSGYCRASPVTQSPPMQSAAPPSHSVPRMGAGAGADAGGSAAARLQQQQFEAFVRELGSQVAAHMSAHTSQTQQHTASAPHTRPQSPRAHPRSQSPRASHAQQHAVSPRSAAVTPRSAVAPESGGEPTAGGGCCACTIL